MPGSVIRDIRWTSRKGDEFEVYVEFFPSLPSIKEVCFNREVQMVDQSEHNYFSDCPENELEFSSSLSIETRGELFEKMDKGYGSPEAIRRVRKAKFTPTTDKVEKLCKVQRSVCGGAVDVPSYLRDRPDCMIGYKRAKCKSKLLELVVDIGTPHFTSAQEIEAVGTAMSTAVCALENAGYRVGITATAGIGDGYHKHIINILALRVKRTSQALNISKMMFALADATFLRGVVFGWLIKTPRISDEAGLGYPLDPFMNYFGVKDQVSDLLRTVAPYATTVVSLDSIIRMYRNAQGEREAKINQISNHITALMLDSGVKENDG